jgi:hypothetical protein
MDNIDPLPPLSNDFEDTASDANFPPWAQRAAPGSGGGGGGGSRNMAPPARGPDYVMPPPPTVTSMRRALVTAHVLETVNNYARADDPLRDAPAQPPASGQSSYFAESELWERALSAPERLWNTEFDIDGAVVSEWVARVPGLGWSEAAVQLINRVEHVESRIGGAVYQPAVKSAHVLSGMGTLRLPPGADGTRLLSISVSGDAALAVPLLVSSDVWDKLSSAGQVEGCAIVARARWQPLTGEWAQHFPITKGIPRGGLRLSDPDAVAIRDHGAPVTIYPFSVAEYASEGAELFDYVYAGARTSEPNYRADLERFFADYRINYLHGGAYLLAADMITPLWDAAYLTPADLRRADASSKSALALLETRVREKQLGKPLVEMLLLALTDRLSDADQLKVLSDEVGIKPATWFAGGSLAEACNDFMAAVVQVERIEALIQRLALRYPGLF